MQDNHTIVAGHVQLTISSRGSSFIHHHSSPRRDMWRAPPRSPARTPGWGFAPPDPLNGHDDDRRNDRNSKRSNWRDRIARTIARSDSTLEITARRWERKARVRVAHRHHCNCIRNVCVCVGNGITTVSGEEASFAVGRNNVLRDGNGADNGIRGREVA